MAGRKILDITNKTFGFLTALEFSHAAEYISPKGIVQSLQYWKFKCICSKIVIMRKNKVTNGSTRSCGCKQHINTRKKDGFASWTVGYLRYKDSARKRNYVFELTFDDFVNITKQSCYYCNELPPLKNLTCKKYNQEDNYKRQFIYINGIDRLNNNEGYTLSNTVPCCTLCNRSKGVLSYSEYLNLIAKQYNNLTLKGIL